MKHENTEYCDCGDCVAKSNFEGPKTISHLGKPPPESRCDCGHSHQSHADSPMGWCDTCSCIRFRFDTEPAPPPRPIDVDGCPANCPCRAPIAPAPPGISWGRWPTLEAIGLLDAIDELEKVAASNSDKHGRKWLTKTLSWHDGKAVKHLGAAQAGQPNDTDTGLPSRAHAALRLVMSLGLELKMPRRPW